MLIERHTEEIPDRDINLTDSEKKDGKENRREECEDKEGDDDDLPCYASRA